MLIFPNCAKSYASTIGKEPSPSRLVRLYASLYEKSMYTVYMIFTPREIFFNDIFFSNPVSYFCSPHLDQFAGILPCKNSPCPTNRVSHPPYTPPPRSFALVYSFEFADWLWNLKLVISKYSH